MWLFDYIKSLTKHWFLFIILIAIIVLYFGKLDTSNFNQDAHFWYERTQNFTKAVLKMDWANTFQNPKPGVTVMWLSGISLEAFLRFYEKAHGFRPLIYTADTFGYINFVTKLPLVASAVIFLLYYFYSIRKLLGNNLAYLSLIILAFEPFFIGVNRLFYGDGMMIITMTAAVLSLFLFKKESKSRYLYLSAILGALALLSKTQAIYVVLFTGLYFVIETLFARKDLKKNSLSFGIWLLVFIVTTFIFFPALWVEPVSVFNSMFSEAAIMTEEGKNNIEPFTFYFFALPGRITYLTSLLFIIGLLRFSTLQLKKENRVYIYSLLFIIFYFLQMSLVSQKIERYIVPVFPFVAVISAYGANYIFNMLKLKFSNFGFKYYLGIILLVCLATPLYYYPYFTAFYNSLGGKYVGYHYVSGYDQVGEFLNSQPKPHNLKVVADSVPQSLRPFVKGTVYGRSETIPNNWTADYYIVDSGLKPKESYSNCNKLVKEVDFRHLQFWDVYYCK